MGRVIHIARTTKLCIEFAGKEEREHKGGYEYKSKHKPRSARCVNTCNSTGRETIYFARGSPDRLEWTSNGPKNTFQKTRVCSSKPFWANRPSLY